MNVLSLFSGIGGLDLGLERAGMTVVGQVEIDPWCRTILAKHWPEVPRHDDVRTAAAWWLADVADTDGSGCEEQRQPEPASPEHTAAERGSDHVADAAIGGRDDSRHDRIGAETCADARSEMACEPRGSRGTERRHATAAAAASGRPAVDVVAGGFPCQPVSLAGKRLGQADSRWLWPPTRDVIRHLAPRWVLLENVPGLLGRGMGDVLGDLAACGYDAEWDSVPACFVGAPHIRNRIWIVAYPQRGGRVGADHGQREHAEAGRGERFATHDDRLAGQASGEPRVLADTGSGRHRSPQPAVFAGRQRPLAHRRWPTEPGVGRVAHGIPRRVDRLRGLGNAVVPQVAEHVGRLIMEAAA